MKKLLIKTLTFKIILILALLNFSLIDSKDVFAAINPEINYQGRLLDDLGDPVADTDFNIQFKLYTVDTGGTEIWTENHCYSPDDGATCDGTGVDSRITTRDGLFSVMLGSVNSLSDVDFNQTLYLGINIGGTGDTPSYDGEMTPRKVLGAVPAAFEAGKLNGITSDQFFRNDILNATNSATTSLAIQQNGAGKVAEFFGSTGNSLFTVQSNGNVGIGTSTPSAMLAVHGTFYASSTSSFGSDVSLLNSSKLYLNPYDYIYSNGGGSTYLSSPFAQSVFITSGQSAQSASLKLSTSENKSAGLIHYDVAHANGRLLEMYSEPGVALSFSPALTEAMRITTGGNVGIGTTNPTAKLEVKTSDTETFSVSGRALGDFTGSPTIGATNGNVFITDGVRVGSYSGLTSVNIGQTDYANSLIQVGGGSALNGIGVRLGSDETYQGPFKVLSGNNTELFRIMPTGNVGIGATAPLEKLDIGTAVASSETGSANIKFSYTPQPSDFNNSIRNSFSGVNSFQTMAFYVKSTSEVNPLTLTGDNRVLINGTPSFNTAVAVGAGAAGLTPTGQLQILDTYNGGSFAHETLVMNYSANQYKTSFGANFNNVAADNFLTLNISSGSSTQAANVQTWLGNGNVGIGTTTPSKELSVDGDFVVTGNIEVSDSTFLSEDYLNFSNTVGSSGFGLRNNAGVIEYKDSSGAWIPLNEIGQETYGYVKFSDVKSDGTDAGTATSGSWFTRTLNTESDDTIGSTLSSNTFTLPAGTYRIDAKVPGFHVNGHQSRLYNVTDGAVSLLGSNATAVNLLSATHSFINGVITIASEKTFRIEQRVQTTRASDGQGSDNGFAGTDELYTVVEVSSLTAESAASGSWTVNGSDISFEGGKVGIGTSNPTTGLLVLESSASSAFDGLSLINSVSGTGLGSNRILFGRSVASNHQQAAIISDITLANDFGEGYLAFQTQTAGALAERMRITNSGDIGIGTSTPQRRLHVQVGSDVAPVRFQDSNGYCEINPTSTTWTCTSDQRLKENILDVASTTPDLFEKMMQLRPVTFEWKTDETNTTRVGLIAQEVELIFPEFVTTDSETGLKTVAYGSFVPYLISVVQDLANKLGELAKRIDEIDLVGGFIAKLTIGSSEKPTGVTLYDEVTGDPYCMSVRNGDMVTKFGECTDESQEPTGNSNDDTGEIPHIFNSNIEEEENPDIIFEDEIVDVEEISEVDEVEEIIEIEDVSIIEETEEVEEVEELDTTEEVQVIFETNNSSGSVELNL
ncbi:MAG: tail fiber domain-containing protein [Candidatus Paceibacterota bacterium]